MRPKVTNVRFLSDADIQAVIRKLSDKVRLGPLTRASRDERKRYFQREHNRQLFPALIGLGATSLRDRVVAELDQLSDPSLRDAYVITSVASHLGAPIPLGVLAAATGLPGKEIASQVLSSNGKLGDVCV